MTLARLHVVGPTNQAIHDWAAEHGIPWDRVTPVTTPLQLRSIATGTPVNLAIMPTAATGLVPSMWSAINTQISIRRALGDLIDVTTEAGYDQFQEH